MVRRNKKGKTRALIAVLVIIIASISAWIYWNRHRPHFVRYPQFGIELPTNFAIHGIDVSKYQKEIDWEEVKRMKVKNIQINFAFMKATEGLNNVDSYFKRNWNKAQQAEMTRGAYHYFLATKSGKAQAKNFVNVVELEKGDLPPVVDIEQTYGVEPEQLRMRLKEFLDTLEEYYGLTPILYTNVDFYNYYLKGQFDHYPLWVAHYFQKKRPRISRAWHFWQHSEAGNVSGIEEKVDFNVFNGDSTDFRSLLLQ